MSRGANAAQNILVLAKAILIGAAGIFLIQDMSLYIPGANPLTLIGLGAVCIVLSVIVVVYVLLHWNDATY